MRKIVFTSRNDCVMILHEQRRVGFQANVNTVSACSCYRKKVTAKDRRTGAERCL